MAKKSKRVRAQSVAASSSRAGVINKLVKHLAHHAAAAAPAATANSGEKIAAAAASVPTAKELEAAWYAALWPLLNAQAIVDYVIVNDGGSGAEGDEATLFSPLKTILDKTYDEMQNLEEMIGRLGGGK